MKRDLFKPTEKIIRIQNELVRQFLAEMFATFLLVVIGVGSVAQYVLYESQMPSLTIAIAFSFSIAMGVIVAGNISGGHMNPAVSIAFLIIGQLTPLRFVIYLMGQFLGAFIGAIMVYVTYFDALNRFDGGVRSIDGLRGTAGVFATYPAPGVGIMCAFVDQLLGTFLFVILILAITDKKSDKRPGYVQALLVGLSCLIVACSYGANCGGAINPFRDLAPRLFTALGGWGFGVFSANNFFFWIPLVAPLCGGALAAVIYAFLIRNHWPKDTKDDKMTTDEGTQLVHLDVHHIHH